MYYNRVISDTECTRIGIDTLRLRLSDYAISDGALLIVKQPPIVGVLGEASGSRLFQTTAGREVYGTEAVAKSRRHDWGLSIKPGFRGEVHARVCVHVPRMRYGSNQRAAGQQDLESVLCDLERALQDVGVTSDLFRAILSRVDLARNVFLDAPFRAYQPVLEALTPKSGMKARRFLNTGVGWSNKRTEALAVYDPQEAALERGLPWDPSWPPMARLETRLLGLPKIRTVLGAERVAGLCARYALLPDIYREQMQRHLFSGEMPALPVANVVDGVWLGAFLRDYKERDDRAGSDNRALAAVAVVRLQESGVPVEEVQECLADVQTSAGAACRARRRVADLYRRAAGARLDPTTGLCLADLYAELRDKTLA